MFYKIMYCYIYLLYINIYIHVKYTIWQTIWCWWYLWYKKKCIVEFMASPSVRITTQANKIIEQDVVICSKELIYLWKIISLDTTWAW